jgi:predicted ABC-type ATPase
MSWHWLDERPVMVAIAGPNGAGKTTFYHVHIRPAGLLLVNADRLAREFDVDAYAAARLADRLRRGLVLQRESFAFETVLSDPVGDKVNFLAQAAADGYTVVLCFIGLVDRALSEERVAMRVSQGGHDVPAEKLAGRFPRTLANLRTAIRRLPHVLIFDNSDLARPFQHVAMFERGQLVFSKNLPEWLQSLIAS